MDIIFKEIKEVNISGHDMIEVSGIKEYNGEKTDWSKRYFANKEDIHNVLSKSKAGDRIRITFDSSKFKNIETVTNMGGSVKPEEGNKDKPASNFPVPQKFSPDQFRSREELINTEALKLAIDLVGTFQGAVKKTATLEFVQNLAIDLAKKNVLFITGKLNDTPNDLGTPVDEPEEEIPNVD